MKNKAIHNGYCLYCGKESKRPFCNRQCYRDYIKGKASRKEQEKQRRDSLSDGMVKKSIYITLNKKTKGCIQYNQITPEMITEKRAQILAWRERRAAPKPVKPIKEKEYRVCIICGVLFEVKGRAIVCGNSCRNVDSKNKYYANRDVILKKMRDTYEPKPKTDQICQQCGNVFDGYVGDTCCSDICRRAAKQGRKARRRAQKTGVYYEPVNALKVFMRDGWRCQLCGKKLKKEHRGTYRDDAPELDHIIPWAQGGEHSYRNTQCACRKCNSDKGSQERGQLRMFG